MHGDATDDGSDKVQEGRALLAPAGLHLMKPHDMVVMVPRSGRVTLNGRRLYNAMLQSAQRRLRAMPAMPPADHMFHMPLRQLLKAAGSNGDDRTAAKRYLREMRGLEVDWHSTAPGEGVKWGGFAMLSEVGLHVKRGESWVAWSFPPTIMAALRETDRWARIDLMMLADLRSYAAVALYEVCARYRSNPSHVTSRKPVAWWADALSPGPTRGERREWRKFKNERVIPALASINLKTDLQVELLEHKEGRAVAEVQFRIRRARPAYASCVTASAVKRAGALRISARELSLLVREFGEPHCMLAMSRLEARLEVDAWKDVEDRYAYLRAVLRRLRLDEGESGPTAVGDSSLQPIAVAADARNAALRAAFALLSGEEQARYVALAKGELAAKRMLTAAVLRQSTEPTPLRGLLGSVILRIYASKMN